MRNVRQAVGRPERAGYTVPRAAARGDITAEERGAAARAGRRVAGQRDRARLLHGPRAASATPPTATACAALDGHSRRRGRAAELRGFLHFVPVGHRRPLARPHAARPDAENGMNEFLIVVGAAGRARAGHHPHLAELRGVPVRARAGRAARRRPGASRRGAACWCSSPAGSRSTRSTVSTRSSGRSGSRASSATRAAATCPGSRSRCWRRRRSSCGPRPRLPRAITRRVRIVIRGDQPARRRAGGPLPRRSRCPRRSGAPGARWSWASSTSPRTPSPTAASSPTLRRRAPPGIGHARRAAPTWSTSAASRPGRERARVHAAGGAAPGPAGGRRLAAAGATVSIDTSRADVAAGRARCRRVPGQRRHRRCGPP